jgi:hypothetical protein
MIEFPAAKKMTLLFGVLSICVSDSVAMRHTAGDVIEYFAERARIYAKRLDENYNVIDSWNDRTFRSKVLNYLVQNRKELSYENVLGAIKKLHYGAQYFKIHIAKRVYEIFGAHRVLDMCAGWGDRYLGALLTPNVEVYHSFDPNKNLISVHEKIRNFVTS